MNNPDPVNSPIHYNQGGIECIDAIKSSMDTIAFRGYLKGNIEKYMWRYEYKKGLQDLLKAQWYLNRLINEISATPHEENAMEEQAINETFQKLAEEKPSPF